MPDNKTSSRRKESRIGSRRRTAKAESAEAYAARRGEIIGAAAEVFQEKGYELSKLQDVAERLNTDRASLYYYFSGKEELLREVVLDGALDNVKETAAIAADSAPATLKLERFIAQMMRSFETNYPQMYVFIQDDLNKISNGKSDFARQIKNATHDCEAQLLQILEQGVREGSFRSDIPLPLVANAAFGMTNWTHRWFRPGARYNAADVAHFFSLLLLSGLSEQRHDQAASEGDHTLTRDNTAME